MADETEAAALPTADEVRGWLAKLRPAAVLSLLKDPDYREAVTPTLNGFQPNAKSFTLPLVQGRLAQAATKDGKLADKLRELSERSPLHANPKEKTPLPAPPLAGAGGRPEKIDPLTALRAERDARRRERDDARDAFAAAQSERNAAVKSQKQAEGERDDARTTAKKQAERIARLERQATKAKFVEARLVKALNEDKVSPPPQPRRAGAEPAEAPATPPSAWPEAVRHLLDKGKFEVALALAEDVLKTDPDNEDALEIDVRAWEGRREPRLALEPARRLLALYLRRADLPKASGALLTIFRLLPQPEQAEADARKYLAALPPANGAAVDAARLMLSRLRGFNPDAHDWLTAYIADRTPLGSVLMPPPDALGPDDALPLPLPLGRPVTARQLADAVDAAQAALVEAARDALRALAAAEPETSARVWSALESAASDDPARLLALRRMPRSAAVVDGSNVAWSGQEALVSGRPRLRSLLAMRRTLWQRGFFPVFLYADATLPHFIDDRPALKAMRDRQELTFVDAGTTADEVSLRVAKQMDAPLITNDKMEDWDPEGEVRKVRYTISMNGEAHLLSEV